MKRKTIVIIAVRRRRRRRGGSASSWHVRSAKNGGTFQFGEVKRGDIVNTVSSTGTIERREHGRGRRAGVGNHREAVRRFQQQGEGGAGARRSRYDDRRGAGLRRPGRAPEEQGAARPGRRRNTTGTSRSSRTAISPRPSSSRSRRTTTPRSPRTSRPRRP